MANIEFNFLPLRVQAKVAALDGAGFYDPFHAEKARQGADKMNNIIAMYTR